MLVTVGDSRVNSILRNTPLLGSLFRSLSSLGNDVKQTTLRCLNRDM